MSPAKSVVVVKTTLLTVWENGTLIGGRGDRDCRRERGNRLGDSDDDEVGIGSSGGI